MPYTNAIPTPTPSHTTSTSTWQKTLHIFFKDGTDRIISPIEEYVCGFEYFFIRLFDGEVCSLARADIDTIYRKLMTGEFRPVRLKRPRYKTFTLFDGQVTMPHDVEVDDASDILLFSPEMERHENPGKG